MREAKDDEILQRDEDTEEVEDLSPMDVARSNKVETEQEQQSMQDN